MKVLLSCLIFISLVSCINAASNSRGESQKKEPGTDNIQAATANTVLKSQLYRNRDNRVLTYDEIFKELRSDGKLNNYRLVPEETDHDGNAEYTVESKKLIDCGIDTSFQNLKAYRTDCENINGENSRWLALEKGISGEGNWNLLHYQDLKAIWEDETTGLLWSYNYGSKNWNEALGTCDKIEGIDTSLVKWILPTRNEFLQADLDGARYVLSETSLQYWTATRDDTDKSLAWYIQQKSGALRTINISKPKAVRCIGIPLK